MTLVKPHTPTFEVTRHTGESWEDCERRAMAEVHRRVQDAVRARGWTVDPDSGETLSYEVLFDRRASFGPKPAHLRVTVTWEG